MNNKLIDLYIKGIQNNYFTNYSSIGGADNTWEVEVIKLEKTLGRERNDKRRLNPEWDMAHQLMDTPLMKALS